MSRSVYYPSNYCKPRSSHNIAHSFPWSCTPDYHLILLMLTPLPCPNFFLWGFCFFGLSSFSSDTFVSVSSVSVWINIVNKTMVINWIEGLVLRLVWETPLKADSNHKFCKSKKERIFLFQCLKPGSIQYHTAPYHPLSAGFLHWSTGLIMIHHQNGGIEIMQELIIASAIIQVDEMKLKVSEGCGSWSVYSCVPRVNNYLILILFWHDSHWLYLCEPFQLYW